jgi:hypothetical protein
MMAAPIAMNDNPACDDKPKSDTVMATSMTDDPDDDDDLDGDEDSDNEVAGTAA